MNPSPSRPPDHLLPTEGEPQRLLAWDLTRQGHHVRREVTVRANGSTGPQIGKADIIATNGPNGYVEVYEVKVILDRSHLFSAVGQALAYLGGLEQRHPTLSVVPYVIGIADPNDAVLYEPIGSTGVVRIKPLAWEAYRELLADYLAEHEGAL